jgi:hypothetical protein
MLPFTGDAAFFDVQPQNFTFTSSGSTAVLSKNEIHVTYAGANLNVDSAKREFQDEVELIKRNLQSLKEAVNQHNGQLEQEIRQQVSQRKLKLLNDAHMAASIGYPIRRREAKSSTYAAPVQRRAPRIAPPPVASSSFKPEPVLAMEEYENILEIICNMAVQGHLRAWARSCAATCRALREIATSIFRADHRACPNSRRVPLRIKMLSVMKHSLMCRDCERLEREYQLTIAEIYSVVDGRSGTVGEKLRELFRRQDVRDKAVKAFYEHKKAHARAASGRPKAA